MTSPNPTQPTPQPVRVNVSVTVNDPDQYADRRHCDPSLEAIRADVTGQVVALLTGWRYTAGVGVQVSAY